MAWGMKELLKFSSMLVQLFASVNFNYQKFKWSEFQWLAVFEHIYIFNPSLVSLEQFGNMKMQIFMPACIWVIIYPGQLILPLF